MGRPSIFTCNVAVVTHGVALERFVTYVARLAARKARQSPHVILMALGSASTALILHSSSCSDSKKCPAALGPRYSTAITLNNDVAVTTGLVVLRPLSVALRGVGLRPLDLGGESLKVGVDDVGGRQLLVVVLEGQLVFTFFPHIHPHGRLADPTALWPVGF